MAVFQSHGLQAIRCRPRYMIQPKVEKNRSGPAERTLQYDDDSIRGFLFFFSFLAMVLVQATGMLYCSLAVTQKFGREIPTSSRHQSGMSYGGRIPILYLTFSRVSLELL